MARKWKILVTATVFLVAVGAWALWSWFPAAKEPGYPFVRAWGERGSPNRRVALVVDYIGE